LRLTSTPKRYESYWVYRNMLDGDKKNSMTIKLNFYIIVNKIYLYNYNDKIIV